MKFNGGIGNFVSGTRWLYVFGLLLPVLWSKVCGAEEISPFKLTGVEGHILVDFLNDGLSTGQTGSSSSSEQNQSILREEIFVMTHSYIYHPNFLLLDIGGGPIRQDNSIDFSGNQTEAGNNLYNLTAKATFLRNKPIHGALFYDHLNPTVSVAPGEIMVQENSRYGVDFSMTNPGIGLPLNFHYLNTHNEGSSAQRVLDDQLEQFSFDISHSYGALGSTSLQYQETDQVSSSGDLNLPIQTTTTNSQGLNLNTQLKFGSSQQYNLINQISFNNRSYTHPIGNLPDQKDSRFLLDFRARPSEKMNYFGTYNYFQNDQGNINLVTQSLAGGFSYLPLPELETSFGARVDQNDSDQYTINSQAVDGSVRYKRALGPGNLQISYSARYEQRDQQALNPLVDVIDEHITLTGTNQISLSHTYVELTSVTITNLNQTQTYVENVDYVLVVVGAETRVERLASGNILDGEEVLVDYTYDIGGTFSSDQLDQTFNVNWKMSRYLTTYFRWFKSSPSVTSGVSTHPINPVDDTLIGIRGEVPMPFGIPFSVGGSIEAEDRRETVSPFKREAGEYYFQSSRPLFGLVNMRFTGRRNHTDYDYSDQDVDLTRHELRLWTRWYGIELNGEASYEEDTGSPILRKRQDTSLRAVWRERKVTVTASFIYSHELQGDFKRDHTMFRLTARRDF